MLEVETFNDSSVCVCTFTTISIRNYMCMFVNAAVLYVFHPLLCVYECVAIARLPYTSIDVKRSSIFNVLFQESGIGSRIPDESIYT